MKSAGIALVFVAGNGNPDELAVVQLVEACVQSGRVGSAAHEAHATHVLCHDDSVIHPCLQGWGTPLS